MYPMPCISVFVSSWYSQKRGNYSSLSVRATVASDNPLTLTLDQRSWKVLLFRSSLVMYKQHLNLILEQIYSTQKWYRNIITGRWKMVKSLTQDGCHIKVRKSKAVQPASKSPARATGRLVRQWYVAHFADFLSFYTYNPLPLIGTLSW